jgi:hypothetical protein
MIIEILILVLSIVCIIFVKNKYIRIICVLLYAGVLCYIIMKLFFPKKENFLDFNFKNDIRNIRRRPELYCGDSDRLPEDYDRVGSLPQCLKKGIGIGMSLPDSYRDEYLDRPPKLPPTERLYCGSKDELPVEYDDFDTRPNCLRRGVGVGLRMSEEKRDAFQHKPRPPINKKEIMDLARRVGVKNPANLSRKNALKAISKKLI